MRLAADLESLSVQLAPEALLRLQTPSDREKRATFASERLSKSMHTWLIGLSRCLADVKKCEETFGTDMRSLNHELREKVSGYSVYEDIMQMASFRSLSKKPPWRQTPADGTAALDGDAALCSCSDDDIFLLSEQQRDARQQIFFRVAERIVNLDQCVHKVLRTGENVLLSGAVLKYAAMRARKRLLVLTSVPRLLYFDMNNGELKGEIPWDVHSSSQWLTVQVKEPAKSPSRAFQVITPKRKYILESRPGSVTPQQWADAVNSILLSQSDVFNTEVRQAVRRMAQAMEVLRPPKHSAT